MKMIRIAIADDFEIFRDGLKAVLASEPDMEIVLEAGNGEDLLEGLESTPADVVMLDLKMPVIDGKKATGMLLEKHPSLKILVVSMYADDIFIKKLREIGAHGYLLKEASTAEIKRSIRGLFENN